VLLEASSLAEEWLAEIDDECERRLGAAEEHARGAADASADETRAAELRSSAAVDRMVARRLREETEAGVARLRAAAAADVAALRLTAEDEVAALRQQADDDITALWEAAEADLHAMTEDAQAAALATRLDAQRDAGRILNDARTEAEAVRALAERELADARAAVERLRTQLGQLVADTASSVGAIEPVGDVARAALPAGAPIDRPARTVWAKGLRRILRSAR
jgi:hypothetical protein